MRLNVKPSGDVGANECPALGAGQVQSQGDLNTSRGHLSLLRAGEPEKQEWRQQAPEGRTGSGKDDDRAEPRAAGMGARGGGWWGAAPPPCPRPSLQPSGPGDRAVGPAPPTGGLGEPQNSGNFSLSMARSSLSNLGLSNRGARCLRECEQRSAAEPLTPSPTSKTGPRPAPDAGILTPGPASPQCGSGRRRHPAARGPPAAGRSWE